MYDQESEEVILASALLTKQSLHKVVEMKADDFYFLKNKIVFSTLQELYENNLQCDSVNLRNRLKDNGMYDKVGDDYFISTCTTVTTSFLQPVIDRVVELSKKRKIADLAAKLNDYSKNSTSSEVMEIAEKSLREINETRSDGMSTLGDYPTAESLELKGSFVKSGFRKFDSITGGFYSPQLIVVGARPAVGKTSLALNIAEHAAKKGKNILLFSLEMSTSELAVRLNVKETGIDFVKIISGRLSDTERGEVTRVAGSLKKTMSNMGIYDKEKNIDEIVRIIKKKHDVGRVDMVFIDYLQLLEVTKKNATRQLDIGEMTRKLKNLTLELGIPIMALSQLSRAVESRVEKMPQLSDLKESGDIEQDANMVILIGGDIEKSKRDIIIAKNRNGPVGMLQMEFINSRMLFRDYSDYNKFDEV